MVCLRISASRGLSATYAMVAAKLGAADDFCLRKGDDGIFSNGTNS